MMCIACTSEATSEVQDGSFWKPICATHDQIFRGQHYLTRPL